MKLIFLLFLFIFSNAAIASEANDYINSGIKLHDEARYDDAAAQYKLALELEPNNGRAYYELTFSYMASNNNEECIKTAEKAIQVVPKLQQKLQVPLGSCYSQMGKPNKAISVFNNGLKMEPKDAVLHLNMAVTLSMIREDKKAISHLKEAIKYSDGYASPYYYLAELYRRTNYRIPALYFYMQFVTLEPNTKRSQDAATKIYALLYQNLSPSDDGALALSVAPELPIDEGDFSVLELRLSLIGAASWSKENPQSNTESIRHVKDLTDFVAFSEEMASNDLASSFTWQYAAKKMVALNTSMDFITFAYILAEKAGMPEASDWLDQNASKIDSMSKAIRVLNERKKGA